MQKLTVYPLIFLIVVLLCSGCAALGLYDKAQEPVITVGAGLQPEIRWTPAEAYELTVYAGAEDGDGIGSIWNAKMGDGYENTLRSPVIYGVPPAGSEVAPADPLDAGQTYTVVVHRKDPNRTGDGFTARGHRYVGKFTFVAK